MISQDPAADATDFYMFPSPDAPATATLIVVLLAAVSFHNVMLGMLLVAAFSVGLGRAS